MKLTDVALRAAYKKLPVDRPVTVDELWPLLAAIADKPNMSMSGALEALRRPQNDLAHKVALVREGMDTSEAAQLQAIVTGAVTGFAPRTFKRDAKALLKLITDVAARATNKGPVGELVFKGGSVSGVAKKGTKALAGVTIEAVNLSAIVNERKHDTDTSDIAVTKSDGSFKGKLAVDGGDYVQLRTRDSNGKWSAFTLVQVPGKDTKNAEINLPRIELAEDTKGTIAVANNNNSRLISEPFAKVQFTNTSTKERFVFALSDSGRFAGRTVLKGSGDHKFAVAVSDGVNNTDFKVKEAQLLMVGKRTLDKSEPAPAKDDRRKDGTSKYNLVEFTGPLAKNGIVVKDVVQGNIGNCFAPGAAMGLLNDCHGKMVATVREATAADRKKHGIPAGVRAMIGTFKKRVSPGSDEFETMEVWATTKLYVRTTGRPVYGASKGRGGVNSMELFWPMFEKLYVIFQNKIQGKDIGYEIVANGGHPSDVFEAVLGKAGDWGPITKDNFAEIHAMAAQKHKEGKPVCFTTKDDHNDGRFAGKGIFGDHTYAHIKSAKIKLELAENLQNPWGESEPKGNGPNDGEFDQPSKQLYPLFDMYYTIV